VRFSTYYRPAMPSGNRQNYFRGSFQFSIATIQKISLPGNLKFNYLGIFQSLKLRISMEKNPFNFSSAINFTPNILGCYGLISTLQRYEAPFKFPS